MKTVTIFFYTLFNQFFGGINYDKPPQRAILSGTAIVVPCIAPTSPKIKNIGIGDTIWINKGYGRIIEINPNFKRCINF